MSLLTITILIKGFRYSIRILYYKLSLKKSLKYNKPSNNIKGDALLFIITKITN